MDMIDITGADLVKLTQAAYDLSVPQGMGFLHYTPGPLTTAEAVQILDQHRTKHPMTNQDLFSIINFDYVRGRAMKLVVFQNKEGRLFIESAWFDHTERALKQLLSAIGVAHEVVA